MSFRLYVGNYPYDFSEEDVKNLFSEFEGMVLQSFFKKGSKCFSFFKCKDFDQIISVIEKKHEVIISGRRLIVKACDIKLREYIDLLYQEKNNKDYEKESQIPTLSGATDKINQLDNKAAANELSDGNSDCGSSSLQYGFRRKPRKFVKQPFNGKSRLSQNGKQFEESGYHSVQQSQDKCVTNSIDVYENIESSEHVQSCANDNGPQTEKFEENYYSADQSQYDCVRNNIDEYAHLGSYEVEHEHSCAKHYGMQTEYFEETVDHSADQSHYNYPRNNRNEYEHLGSYEVEPEQSCTEDYGLQTEYFEETADHSAQQSLYNCMTNSIGEYEHLESSAVEQKNSNNHEPQTEYFAEESSTPLQDSHFDECNNQLDTKSLNLKIDCKAESKCYEEKSPKPHSNHQRYKKYSPKNLQESYAYYNTANSEFVNQSSNSYMAEAEYAEKKPYYSSKPYYSHHRKYHYSSKNAHQGYTNENNASDLELLDQPSHDYTIESKDFEQQSLKPHYNYQQGCGKYARSGANKSHHENSFQECDTGALSWVSVSNFPIGTTKRSIYQLFSDHHPIKVQMLCNQPRADKMMTEALVSFRDNDVASDVILNFDNTVYKGRVILVTDVEDLEILNELIGVTHA